MVGGPHRHCTGWTLGHWTKDTQGEVRPPFPHGKEGREEEEALSETLLPHLGAPV